MACDRCFERGGKRTEGIGFGGHDTCNFLLRRAIVSSRVGDASARAKPLSETIADARPFGVSGQHGASGPAFDARQPRPTQAIDIHAPVPVRAYVQRIARCLEDAGHRVRIVGVRAATMPRTVDWLLYFERLAYRVQSAAFAPLGVQSAAFAPLDVQGAPDGSGGHTPCDLAIDLTGSAADGPVPTLRLVFDGGSGEGGLVAALLDSAAPNLQVIATERNSPSRLMRTACLAVERPLALATALDGVTPRLATLIAGVVEQLTQIAPSLPSPTRPVDLKPQPSAPAFAAHALSRKISDRIARLVRRPNCWHIAVRTVEGDGVMERCDWSGPAWQILPDDGRRYYADPFLFAWQGRRWLFCEEYPHATAKGILSVAAIDQDGRIGTPRPIMESAGHLSWPQVFSHDGQVYMIPESAADRVIALWRAEDFPTRWVRECVLVSNVRAHDPLLHRTSRGAVLLATLDDDGGSCWDALGLFSAPSLFGPWRAHANNPVLIDASSARPAGPILARGTTLWRATQDCREGYGAGLALCRVTRLDEGGFSQEVVTRLAPPPDTGARGVHTLSRLGDLEAIDLLGTR